LTDSDGNGVPDVVESPTGIAARDTDGDSVPDSIDLDSDNDGIPDVVETGHADVDGNGRIDPADWEDTNGNGMNDNVLVPKDTDGDSLPDYRDLDSDNDGIPDIKENTNFSDDFAPYGVIDGFSDSNTNGWADSAEVAYSSGNIPPFDADGDGVPNYMDLDSDSDGLPDVLEAGGIDNDSDGRADGFVDSGNGLHDTFDTTPLPVPDTDSDGVADFLDLDSDNDALPDLFEGGLDEINGDWRYDDVTDRNSNGWADSLEGVPFDLTDTDGDGVPDHVDLDSITMPSLISSRTVCSLTMTFWILKTLVSCKLVWTWIVMVSMIVLILPSVNLELRSMCEVLQVTAPILSRLVPFRIWLAFDLI